MQTTKWFVHPIIVFVFSIVALAMSLILYIYWYMEVSAGLEAVIRKANLDPAHVLESQTWVVILVLSILVGIILVGIFIIFVYNQKTIQLYRLQRNFINSFTHELKTPVTSLKLYLETFLKHELSRDEQCRYIRYMIQDVDRLSDNVGRMLNLAQIESKTYGGDFVEADLFEVIGEFCRNNNHLFLECDINIDNPSNRSFPYRINPSLFEMLLMNLLTNAVTYNDSRVPRVDISFVPQARKLHIRFADNGIGLEKNELKKVFKVFYQVGKTDDMSAKGIGLGLYLVQNIARIHKGKAMAESVGKGKGSVFTLLLPYHPA
jgi:signal transduction histidine kinase